MTEKEYKEDEYLKEMIAYALSHDSRRSIFEIGGEYYGRDEFSMVVVPLGANCKGLREPSYFEPVLYYWMYSNAELLRRTLVDESVPLSNHEGDFLDIYDGCRRSNATAMGALSYWPALPELREAMLHERDSYLRENCVEAIGMMGERGFGYAKDIRESIRKFRTDAYYQRKAVDALARLDDKEAVALLRELYEEARDFIDRIPFKKAFSRERQRGYGTLIGRIISALTILHPETAREILAMELANPSPHVRHFVKSAFQLSPLDGDLILMERIDSVTVSLLPNDPRRMFQRQKRLRFEPSSSIHIF